VLIGTAHIPIPNHPRIHHLGFLDDQDKYDAMAAAELLIMPSYLESLSMVALEAWAMGKPVLANAKCDVLQGQCLRSNAGLFYANYAEFAETMRAIDTTPSLQAALGRNGRAFFEKHYAWPVIEKKYVDMLQQLSGEPAARTMESAPGWFGRRRRTQPPAESIVKQLPSGACRETPVTVGPLAAPSARASAGPPQTPAASVPPAAAPSRSQSRPEQPARGDQRRDGRGPRQQDRRPRGEGRDRRPAQARPQQQPTDAAPGKAKDESRKPKTEGQERPNDRAPRDPQRRGRPHRRGRRPGGSGGNGGNGGNGGGGAR